VRPRVDAKCLIGDVTGLEGDVLGNEESGVISGCTQTGRDAMIEAHDVLDDVGADVKVGRRDRVGLEELVQRPAGRERPVVLRDLADSKGDSVNMAKKGLATATERKRRTPIYPSGA
jgi:hypothetical protein